MSSSAARTHSLSADREEKYRQLIIKKSLTEQKKSTQSAFAEWASIYTASINPDDLHDQHVDFFAKSIARAFAQLQTHSSKKAIIDIVLAPSKQMNGTHSLITLINDDMPFLVDSTTGELHRMGLQIEAVVHPTIYIDRSKDGGIAAIHPPRHLQKVKPQNDGQKLSIIQFMIRTPAIDIDAKAVKENLARILSDVRQAVEDWTPMREKLAQIIGELPAGIPSPAERDEARRFLEWLDQDHFTFLGYRAYDYPKNGGSNGSAKISIRSGTGLGVIRNPDVRVFGDLRDRNARDPELQSFLKNPAIVSISKSNSTSGVHRPVPMDVISIKRYDDTGKVVGEHRFVGLFTSLAYSRNPRDIPLLRQKVDNIIKQSGWSPTGHKAKILIDVLVSFPRDELIQIDEAELFPIAMGITRVQEKIRTALFLRRDKFNRYISALIYTPRETFTSNLREKFAEILTARLDGKIRNFYTQLSDQLLARIHFIIDIDPASKSAPDAHAIESELIDAARSWPDRLREAVIQKFGMDAAPDILRRYAHAFSLSYQNLFPLNDAIVDIDHIDRILFGRAPAPGFAAHIYNRGDAAKGEFGLTLYHQQEQLALSDILPMLENMGLRILNEIPFAITPAHLGEPTIVWSHDMAVVRHDGQAIDIDKVRELFIGTLAGIRSGEYEDDGFNRLVIANRMTGREIVIFRTYAKYLRQIGFGTSQSTIEQTLAKHSAVSKKLLQLFYALFDPGAQSRNNHQAAQLRGDIMLALESITNAEEDRILRKFLNVITATLRTNYFQNDEAGKPKSYLSVKLASGDIADLPEPKPWREIFVCSPAMEAIHLRSGKVARGGIRHSDRREDFRTEILGLVKAQIVKNTVIVPVGSKGGFVIKQAPSDPALQKSHVVECYKTMMRGLLDITDNLKNGKIIAPQSVVRLDEDDPYLVVAADKGTAKFSDIANSVSAEYDFWLGDAFASGGSAGYDHKELAITARGGWVAVERHFRELNMNIAKNPFTAIGVGDMAGDVFGNGMLRSKNMKLLAAFNHAHIFIDPNPDPAASFKERQRLFDHPQLTWADYDKKLISKGGGVYGRDAKKITLSAEARQALGTDINDGTPAQIIQAILKSQVDLLWMGGIGTFVKSASENNADAGDRSNDALRINGKDLRCKIVGEGANLGFTQLGRVEYALNGGRINTDAIDNSGGVDTSDHEVNIKILLSAPMQSGKLPRKQRDILLRSMQDDICRLVLADNFDQTLALSFMQQESATLLDEYARQIRVLEKTAKLNRTIEFLPNEEELAERNLHKSGLTRPELAILLAYSKMALSDNLLRSRVVDDPAFERDLALYFPAALQKKYAAEIASHPLRREIIATCLTNYMINRTGVIMANNLAEITGMDVADVVMAYAALREIFELDGLWNDIVADSIPSKAQIHMIHALNRFVERGTLWFLRQRKARQSLSQILAKDMEPIRLIQKQLPQLLPVHDRGILERKVQDYVTQGVPESIAQRVVFIRMLGGIGDVVNIAQNLKKPAPATAALYFKIGERFALDWMRRAASKFSRTSSWQNRAISSLIDDLLGLQARLTKEIAKNSGVGENALQKWLLDHRQYLTPVDNLLTEIQSAPALDAAMITVAIAKIRSLLV